MIDPFSLPKFFGCQSFLKHEKVYPRRLLALWENFKKIISPLYVPKSFHYIFFLKQYQKSTYLGKNLDARGNPLWNISNQQVVGSNPRISYVFNFYTKKCTQIHFSGIKTNFVLWVFWAMRAGPTLAILGLLNVFIKLLFLKITELDNTWFLFEKSLGIQGSIIWC